MANCILKILYTFKIPVIVKVSQLLNLINYFWCLLTCLKHKKIHGAGWDPES